MSRTVESALARALTMNFMNFTGLALVETVDSTAWASITFSGALHRLKLVFSGDGAVGAAADFLEVLPDLDLPIADAIVADIALLSEARCDDGAYAVLDLEALTIAGP